ncbi:MAG: 2OG-Fe(II) oxygenase family protein [Candidatus Kapaibacteriales bacterium]
MERYEALIDGLVNENYAYQYDFFERALLLALKDDLLELYEDGALNPAGIGKRFDYERNLKVRGDKILWLSKSNNAIQKEFLEEIEGFISYMNRTCYTNLNDYEFHYTVYKPGSFYRRHLDQFRSDRGRQFSLVTYLNEDWKTEDGGQITLYLDESKELELLPNMGTSVIFKSDEVEHEVKQTNKHRLSIAGWLKSV